VGETALDRAVVLVDAAEQDILIVLRVAAAVVSAADPLAALDEEVREQLTRFVERDFTGGEVALKVFAEQHINPSDAGPVAAEPDEREREPQALHRLAEIRRRLERHAAEYVGVLRISARFKRVDIAVAPD